MVLYYYTRASSASRNKPDEAFRVRILEWEVTKPHDQDAKLKENAVT